MTQNGPKSQKMAYFLNPSVKNFDFLTKSFIYIFLICFGTFFPVAKNLGQKWFGGGVADLICRAANAGAVGKLVSDQKMSRSLEVASNLNFNNKLQLGHTKQPDLQVISFYLYWFPMR